MALDLTAINQWIEERANKEDIILKPFLASPELDYMRYVRDVTGQIVKLPILSADGKTSDTLCNTTDTDDLKISQFTIQAFYNNYRNGFCLDELQKYFTHQWKGSIPEGLTYAFDVEVGMKVVRKAKQYLWLSNTGIAALDADFKRFNGILKQIDTNVPAANKYVMGAGKVLGEVDNATTEKVTTVIDTLYNKLPAEAKIGQNIVAFVGSDVFSVLQTIIRKDNLYHYKVEDLKLNNYAIRYPGIDNLTIVAVDALRNNAISNQDNTQKDRIVMTPVNNIAVSLDESGIKESMKVWYSDDLDKLFIRFKYWLGAGIVFPDLITTSIRS